MGQGKNCEQRCASEQSADDPSCCGSSSCCQDEFCDESSREGNPTGTIPPGSNPGQDDLKDLLLRTQANFENYRKQAQKRMEEMQEMAARDCIVGVLPIFDNIDLALKHIDATNPENFIKGVTLISTQFMTFLEQNGVTTIPTLGAKFDPFLHEAILKVTSDESENTILEEYQRGFMLHGKVIRHAKVKVSAGAKK